jgi:glycosyltransferase involved in cell wall biosynthesis
VIIPARKPLGHCGETDRSRNVAELPLISIIICTRNRALLLRKAIASVVSQNFPQSEYEVVIVDNGSTDQTSDIAREFQDRAQIRYIQEKRVGLCIARNTGWRVAEGRYIAFFDDDAIACPGWLQAIRRAFEDPERPIGVVGGRVRPIWEREPPSWLADEIAGSLTIVDWGPFDKTIDDLRREWLVGANMAVPKAILLEVGGFHPWLDRVGSSLLSSGDVYLQREIIRRGFCCQYVPQIAIKHLVPTSRLNQRWFLRRFFWQGVSDAVMYLIENAPSPPERLRPAALRGMRLISSWRRLTALALPTEQPEVFTRKCFALIDLGFILGLLGLARH